MTEQEAYDFVRNTFDDDEPDHEQLVEAFVAVFGRQPDADEANDAWSHLCAATPGLCGCSTRREHESVKVRVWDEATSDEFTFVDGHVSEPSSPLELVIIDGDDFESAAHDIWEAWSDGYDGDPQNICVSVEACGRQAVEI